MSTGENIFNFFKKNKKPTIYLGLAVVVPRKDFKRHFELFVPKNIDSQLEDLIINAMGLPRLPDTYGDIEKDSFVLDIAVSEHQFGGFWDLGSIKPWLIFIWRPKVQIRYRIYKIENKQTIADFKITKKMKWIEVLKRMFSVHIDINEVQYTKYILVSALKELDDRIWKIIL